MAAVTKRLFIIDGNSLLHRAWHAIPPLTTKDGLVVNAAYGFAMALDNILHEHKPTHLVVCWDVKGGTFRDDMFEDYKAGREEKEQELYDQIDIINDILDAHGIPAFGIEGYEADDVIGTIAEIERHNDETDTIIITGDLDTLQLVDKSTEVLFFVKGLTKLKTYDIDAVEERYGFGPEHVVDYKALCGDPSDNIPGVKGVGKKTATDLIQKYGGVDEIYDALKAGELEGVMSTSVVSRLETDEKNARMSEELATIVRDVEMDFSMDDAQMDDPDWTKIRDLYRELEFSSLLRRLERRGLIEDAKPAAQAARKVSSGSKVTVDVSGSHAEAAIERLSKAGVLAFDVVSHEKDLFGSSITALALSDGKTSYVFKTPSAETVDVLRDLLATKPLVTHDLKSLLHELGSAGIDISSEGIDLMVAGYVEHVGDRSYSIESILAALLGTRTIDKPAEYTKDGAFEALGAHIAQYISAASEIEKRMRKSKTLEVFEGIEQPLVSILYEMERDGVELNKKTLATMSKEFEGELNKLTKKIHKLAGSEFNVNSPSQLADVLFQDLELPTKGIKKTKTGYSTAASELEKLAGEHEIVPLIGDYRELAKLKSTYIDALPELVESDGRIHTSFNQTVTATGRLSSSDPNLQNIPIRTDLGREIRRAFVAPKGSRLVALDYSQIELRLVAAFSEDEVMLDVFKKGGDIHRTTAAKVFGVAEDKVTKKQRRAAKAVNFGIIYGMGPRALSRNIDVSFTEAKEFIARYFEIFPTVKEYLDSSLEMARDKGYAETVFGRRRELPELTSGVQMVRASAERMAVNMPLQGSGADIIKKAMIEADAWLADSNLDAKMILQVHDELVFEVKDKDVNRVAKAMKEIMEGVVDLAVPLTVDVEVGQNWKDLKGL